VINPELKEWRRKVHGSGNNYAVRGLGLYKGSLRIVWSEHDEDLPTQVLQSYVEAIGSDDSVEILMGTTHVLDHSSRAKALDLHASFFKQNYPTPQAASAA
jgi:hypothetical protein